ncbi:DUF1573 domain-containing protein [Mongoliitalea daihaiensis]|uniref:DUF1573 domain-containing protein n=1 Tax=Mongoliitalea daihaiensis TaxID=2782006 RepID=UPI001F3A2624|nr:DUF1573 domain-containing protein [Mongoliitalea daihaiensis]UJP63588.1 DUF1573 domain-containing protein [Mongoliitalea daihaiensis]
MKKYFLLMVMMITAVAVQAQSDSKGAVISFKEKSIDFGDITQGDKVEHVFLFENTGDTPLVISNVAVTCGCTAPSWPRQPVAPGSSAELKVVFNSAGKMGKQNSVIRIYSNASEPIEKVSLISNVKPKA